MTALVQNGRVLSDFRPDPATVQFLPEIPRLVVLSVDRAVKMGVPQSAVQDVETSILIPDYKNYQVKKGDIIRITFDVSPIMSVVLSGGSSFVTLPPWIESLKFNISKLSQEVVNRVLNYGTSIGVLRNKILVDFSQTKFQNNFKEFVFTFRVTENSWPLVLVAGAVVAVTGFIFLSVREARLIKQTPSSATSLAFGVPVLAALGFLLFAMFNK